MNSDEQTLIDGLFSRLKQAEQDSGPRDALADQRIKEHVASQPAVAYYMAQSILVQEAALKRMDQQNKQLKDDLAKAQASAAQPAQSGGFLSGLFGSGSREPAPAPAPSSSNGWREPGNAPAYGGQSQPQQNYAPPPQQQAPAAPAGGGFMKGALQTAAGVAGGVMLAEGISSLFHHNSNPQEIVEVIQEEPGQYAGNNDLGNSGNGNNDWGNQPAVGNDSWANNDTDNFSSDDGGGFFSDDDDYV